MVWRKTAVAFALAAMSATSAFAGKCYWVSDANGGQGGWNDSRRWRNRESGGNPTGDQVVPQSGDDIYVNKGEAVVSTESDVEVLRRGGWLVVGSNGRVRLCVSGEYTIPGYLAGLGTVVVERGDVTLAKKNDDATPITVTGGSLALPAPSSSSARTFGVVTVNSPGVLYLPAVKNSTQGYYKVTGLSGDGSLVATGGTNPEVESANLMFAGDSAGTTFVFSGTMSGVLAPQINGGKQYLTNDSNANSGDFRFTKGVLGVSRIGNGGSQGSFGSSVIWVQNGGAGNSATLRYLGTSHETTTRSFVTSSPTASNEIVLDGGEHGVTFAGAFSNNGAISGRSLMLALDGSATNEPSCFTGSFPGSDTDGVVHIAKRGTGTWLFPASSVNCHYNGGFAVEEGTLAYESLDEAGSWCSLGWATTLHERYSGAVDASRAVPYAYKLGNGVSDPDSPSLATFEYKGAGNAVCRTRPIVIDGAARVRNATTRALEIAGVTSLSAGENTLVLDAPGVDNIVRDVTNGVGTVSVVKEGDGTWTLDGNVDISGKVDVRKGELRYRWRQDYTWFRLTFKSTYASKNLIKFGHIGLFAEDGTEQALGLVYRGDLPPAAVSKLRPGEVTFGSTNNRGANGNADALETLFAPYVLNANKDLGTVDYSVVSPSDHSSWIIVVLRLPAGAAPVVRYDMVTGWYYSSSRPYDGTVTQWTIEGSTDGVTWSDIEQGERNLRYSGSGNYWMSDGSLVSSGVVNPTGFPVAASPATPCYDKMSSLSSLSVARGASFATDGEVSVSRLDVDCLAGCGCATGVVFAASGTLSVGNMPDLASVFVEVPFASANGFDNLSGWDLVVNGKAARPGKYIVDTTQNGIRISKHGIIISIR